MDHLHAVGQILYATAICDGKLRPVEENKLRDSFITYSRAFNTKREGEADSTPKTEFILEEVKLQKLSPLEYFENFKNHYHNHPEEFLPELKELILKSINSIASSYAKQNKSEVIIVAKTRLLLSPV